MKSRYRYWVGVKSGVSTVFQSIETPTEQRYGHLYGAVIGPFRTHRGAAFMADFGSNNPHCQTVAQAERIAKKVYESARALKLSLLSSVH
jgi:hypothetical protein